MVAQSDSTEQCCRLCAAVCELRDSHIIPRFMFRRMSRLAAPETPLRFDPSEGTNQPGHLREPLLCHQCEGQFSAYERVASNFFDGLSGDPAAAGSGLVFRSSLDYRSLRLFFLSLLWRCAVCQDRITGAVNLKTRLSVLTDLLEKEDPGADNDFPIILNVLAESLEARNAVLTVPEPVRRASRRGYTMVGSGLEISWIVDKRGASREDIPYVLHEDGSWLIAVARGRDCPVWVRAVENAHEQDCRTTS